MEGIGAYSTAPLKTEMIGQNYRVLWETDTCYSWGSGIGKRGENNMNGSFTI